MTDRLDGDRLHPPPVSDAQAQEVGVSPGDSIQTVPGALSGREFFDAAVPLEKIEAVLVRSK